MLQSVMDKLFGVANESPREPQPKVDWVIEPQQATPVIAALLTIFVVSLITVIAFACKKRSKPQQQGRPSTGPAVARGSQDADPVHSGAAGPEVLGGDERGVLNQASLISLGGTLVERDPNQILQLTRQIESLKAHMPKPKKLTEFDVVKDWVESFDGYVAMIKPENVEARWEIFISTLNSDIVDEINSTYKWLMKREAETRIVVAKELLQEIVERFDYDPQPSQVMPKRTSATLNSRRKRISEKNYERRTGCCERRWQASKRSTAIEPRHRPKTVEPQRTRISESQKHATAKHAFQLQAEQRSKPGPSVRPQKLQQ